MHLVFNIDESVLLISSTIKQSLPINKILYKKYVRKESNLQKDNSRNTTKLTAASNKAC